MPNVLSVDATLAQLLDAIGDGGAAGKTAGAGAGTPGTPTIPPAARDARRASCRCRRALLAHSNQARHHGTWS